MGLDVKAMRTQKDGAALRHLANSRRVFLRLLEISRSLSEETVENLRNERDYEALDAYIIDALLGH